MSFISKKIINDMKKLDALVFDGVNRLIEYTKNRILQNEKYRLFYMIQEIYRTNIFSFEINIIEYDFGRFAMAKRNTRTAIELYLDLYNLIKDAQYIEVIKYNCEKIDENNGVFQNFIDKYKIGKFKNEDTNNIWKTKHKIDMFDKRKLALALGQHQQAIDTMKILTKDYNHYVHTNIFDDFIIDKETDIKRLLSININLYNGAYQSLIKEIMSNLDNNTERYNSYLMEYTESLLDEIDNMTIIEGKPYLGY